MKIVLNIAGDAATGHVPYRYVFFALGGLVGLAVIYVVIARLTGEY